MGMPEECAILPCSLQGRWARLQGIRRSPWPEAVWKSTARTQRRLSKQPRGIAVVVESAWKVKGLGGVRVRSCIEKNCGWGPQ